MSFPDWENLPSTAAKRTSERTTTGICWWAQITCHYYHCSIYALDLEIRKESSSSEHTGKGFRKLTRERERCLMLSQTLSSFQEWFFYAQKLYRILGNHNCMNTKQCAFDTSARTSLVQQLFFVSHYSTFSPWTQQQFKLYFFRGHATSLIRKSTLSISLLSASLVWCECNHTWFSRLRNLFVSSPFHSFSSLSLDFLQALCREWPVWQRPPGNSATALGAIYWPLGTLTVAAIIW